MYFSALALLPIQLIAKGMDPREVLFAEAFIPLTPFNYFPVERLEETEIIDKPNIAPKP
jgi:hypothetical protein